MARILEFAVIFTLITLSVYADEVCFDNVGCFTDEGCHQAGFPPRSPEYINTRFFLYTRSNKEDPQQLIIGDDQSVRNSNFDPNRKTKFTAHGWFSNGFTGGELDRKDAFLEVEDANVIIVDWRRGAAFGRYGIAHQNCRVAGREIGRMLRFLNLLTGMYFKDVHMLGFSLGAHTVGYAGEDQPGVGRITGLDPAGPLFREGGFDFRINGPQCRLDPTDALFVDVIHTDANGITGLGNMLQLGHQDFYPNGGRTQPGCDGFDLTSGCSHSRGSRLFTESIRQDPGSCAFIGHACGSWAEYFLGSCRDCEEGECAVMGYRADETITGKFYLETNGQSPYCMS